MLSTKMRLELTDILCRMITTDGVPVTLEERVWMNKLIEHKCCREPGSRTVCVYLFFLNQLIKQSFEQSIW